LRVCFLHRDYSIQYGPEIAAIHRRLEAGMRFGYSLTFLFHDDHWFRKIFLPAIWLLVPVLGLVSVLGWACEICRRVVGGQSEELPALDFRRNVSDGIRICGILLIYSLPVLIVAVAGGLLASPYFLSEKDAIAAGVTSTLCAIECVILLIAMADGLLISAAIGRYASGEKFSSVLRPGGSLRLIRSAPSAYLFALLGFFPLALLALSGSLICLIGSFFTSAYAAASAFHLNGQAYLVARSRPSGPVASAAGK
jgi:hypothetical protein